MYEKQVQLKNGTRKMYYNNVTYTLHQLESHVSYSKNHKKPLSLYLPFINTSLSIVKNHVRKKKKLFNCLNSHVILKSINGHWISKENLPTWDTESFYKAAEKFEEGANKKIIKLGSRTCFSINSKHVRSCYNHQCCTKEWHGEVGSKAKNIYVIALPSQVIRLWKLKKFHDLHSLMGHNDNGQRCDI